MKLERADFRDRQEVAKNRQFILVQTKVQAVKTIHTVAKSICHLVVQVTSNVLGTSKKKKTKNRLDFPRKDPITLMTNLQCNPDLKRNIDILKIRVKTGNEVRNRNLVTLKIGLEVETNHQKKIEENQDGMNTRFTLNILAFFEEFWLFYFQ